MIDPHKPKYFQMYWSMALAAASESECKRRKVGAIIVAPTGMISVGWNGLPAGMEGSPEVDLDGELVTRPEVIHAERNAIDKMTRQGVPIEGSILLVTTSPCVECAKSIHGLGFKHIYYLDKYRCERGLNFLDEVGVPHTHYTSLDQHETPSCSRG